MLTNDDLVQMASETGFQVEALGKVEWLLELLDGIRSHHFLKGRLALKGGTALNLFLFSIPRLSVDVDVNYIGGPEPESMQQERPNIEQAIHAVCGRLGLQVKRSPSDHAGGKWRLSYSSQDRSGSLELDVNFMLRTPLWSPVSHTSRPIGSLPTVDISLLDIHELVAGKLAALFGRSASRDLFDTRELLIRGGLDRKRLRLAFVIYGGMNRKDWRTIAIDDIATTPTDVSQRLVPMLRADVAPSHREVEGWTKRLVADCKDLLSSLLPLEPHEQEFLEELNDRGQILPTLLTDDPRLRKLVQGHPGLLWKAVNVRRYRGIDQG